jgi:hypothetical protein
VSACSTFNTAGWTQVGGSGGMGPTFGGGLVKDPGSVADAQEVTFTDPRSGFYEVIVPALAASTTYTASISSELVSGTPNFYLGYYSGDEPVTKYSSLITPGGVVAASAGVHLHDGRVGSGARHRRRQR